MNEQEECLGSFFLGTACRNCKKCKDNRINILFNVLPKVSAMESFDNWIANKPSYYTEETRQAFIAGWKASRGE